MSDDELQALTVMQSRFIARQQQTFDELFDAGRFDTLHAITYSSTFDVVYL